jgi:hypothetical protein
MTSFRAGDRLPLDDPGRGLGIIGLIFSISGIFCGLLGILGATVSTVAFLRSRKAGFFNRWALAGIIVGLAMLLLGVVLFLFFPITVQVPS